MRYINLHFAYLLTYLLTAYPLFPPPAADTGRGHSADTADYVLTRTRTKFGQRDFCCSGPAAVNSLSSELHYISDTNTFKKRLKSVLFDLAYQ